MISLLTFPDITYTGFKIVVIGLNEDMQSHLTDFLSQTANATNIAIFDLKIDSDSVDYVLAVLETSDLVIVNSPNIFYWLTGYILSLPNCYYIEFDSKTLNTLYKLSLRALFVWQSQEIGTRRSQ